MSSIAEMVLYTFIYSSLAQRSEQVLGSDVVEAEQRQSGTTSGAERGDA